MTATHGVGSMVMEPDVDLAVHEYGIRFCVTTTELLWPFGWSAVVNPAAVQAVRACENVKPMRLGTTRSVPVHRLYGNTVTVAVAWSDGAFVAVPSTRFWNAPVSLDANVRR